MSRLTTRSGFTVGLLVLVGVLVEQSLTLTPASRVAPLWVLLPTAFLLLVQLLVDLNPGLGETRTIFRGSVVAPGRAGPATDARGASATVPTDSRRKRELRLVFWIAWLIGLVYLLGVLLSTALFLLPYLRLESRLGWRRAVVLTALATGVIHLVFDVVARVPLPPPALF